MSKITQNVKYLKKALEKYDPVVVDYGKDKVIGFPNDINNNDLVLFIREDETVMTFGYQNAHFSSSDNDSVVIHTVRYLESEYASVEFFQKTKDLFGGSRLSSTVKFDTIEGIVDCYSAGNEQAKEGLYEFFKNNKDITVRAVTFDNSINTVVAINYDGKEFKLETIR